jgi:hypothetical protein
MANQPKKPKENENAGPGQPTKMTPDCIRVLADCFMKDLNIREACSVAGIHYMTYRQFLKDNKEYIDIFETCRSNVKIKAKLVVAAALEKDPQLALRYLTKRSPDYKDKLELSGGLEMSDKAKEYKDVKDNINARLEEIMKRVVDGPVSKKDNV